MVIGYSVVRLAITSGDMDSVGKDEKPPEKKKPVAKKTPIKVTRAQFVKALKIYGMVFCLLFLVCGSPWLRSGLNPIACFWFTSLSDIEGSSTCTTVETPQFKIHASGSGKYRLGIYAKAALPPDTKKLRKAFEISPIPDVNIEKAIGVLLQAKPLFSFAGDLQGRDLNYSEALITLPKPLPPGDYLLLAQTINPFFPAHPDRTARCFRVSNLGLVVKEAPDQTVIQAVDLVTLSARAGVEIAATAGQGAPLLTQVRTATDGTAIIKGVPAGQTVFYAHAGHDYATNLCASFYESEWIRFGHLEDQDNQSQSHGIADLYRLHFATDRSVYRLGQTVLFKGTTRCFKPTGLCSIGGNIAVKIRIDDPDGDKVSEGTLITNKFGAFNGSVHLAPTLKTGTYSVSFKYPDGAELQEAFEVIEYRKPEYDVKIVPLTPWTIAGNKLKVKVQARYYFGAPVANAKVQYTVSSSLALGRSLEGLEAQGQDINFFKDSAPGDSGDFDSGTNDGASLTQAQTVTDQTGVAIIEISTQAAPERPKGPLDTSCSDRTYVIKADVTDLGLKTVSSEGSALVVPGDFALQVKMDSYIVKEKEPIDVAVYARGYDGRPIVNHKLSVGLCRWSYNILSGKFDRQDTVSVQTVSTDAMGKATVKLNGSQDLSGDAYVFAESQDDQGRRVFDETSIWAVGAQFPDWFSDSEKPMKLVMDKECYRPGDVARVFISTSIKGIAGTPAFISVDGCTIYDYKCVKMTGNMQLVELPIRSLYAPNVFLTVTLLDRQHKACTLSKEIKVYPKDGLFKVAVKSDKARYEPGESATYTIKTTRLDGTPAAGAEVNLAVADESIFAISRQKNLDIQHCIYAPLENLVKTSVTFQGFNPLSSPPAQLWRWDQAAIAIPVGVAIPPIMALTLLRAPPAITLLCIAGGAVVVTMMVTGKVSEQESTFKQARMELESRASIAGLPPPQAAAPSPAVRSDFRDTAYWSPALITDAKGIARAVVKLPDSLTTWRATAWAIDLNRSVGSDVSKVITSKSLIARLSLPRFYCQGDRAFITGIVHNYSGKTQPVRVTLTCSPHFEITEKLVREITIFDNQAQEISWPVTVSGSGTATIKLEALGQAGGDALEIKIPIRPFALTDFRANSGVIKEEQARMTLPIDMGLDGDAKSAQYELDLSASEIGPVLGNFSALIDYPYGCSEQTISRLIPSVVAMRLRKDLGVALPSGAREKFEKVRTRSLAKLADLQLSDGGWGWWKTDQRSDPYLTAYVLEGLYQLAQVGYPVDQKSLERGLTRLRNYGRTIILQPWDRERATDHARLLYVLSLYGEKPQAIAVAWHLGQSLFAPPEALSYLTMAFHNSGNKKASALAYAQLIALANKTDDFLDWDHTPAMIARLHVRGASTYTYRFTGVETTALALQAVLAMEPDNEDRRAKIRSWILLHRGKDGWENTKTTAQVFMSLLADDLATHKKVATNFKARAVEATTGKLVKELIFNQSNMYQAETKCNCVGTAVPAKIIHSKEGKGTLFYNSLLTFQRKLKAGESLGAKSMPKELGVTREFFRLAKVSAADDHSLVKLKLVPASGQIKAGETLLMRVAVKSSITVPYVMIEVPLPSGAEVVSKDASDLQFVAEKENGKETQPMRWWWSHQDVLDDRVVYFVTDFPAGTSELTTLVRMEMPGHYNINPAQMQGMYTNKVRSYSTADSLEVLRQ